jgi:UDP-glucuronate decarboxylase
MDTILVTGGAGFIGTHLIKKLLEDSSNVVLCLDNLFTGSKNNITQFLDNPNFEFIRHDVVNEFNYEVDFLYNLACPASPIHYQFNPIKTTKASILGTMNCLGLAKRVKCRVLHASTSEVYGDPKEHPQKETYNGNVNPIGIRACYDEGKRCAETLCYDYYREHAVDVRVARIFNTYGPYMDPADGRVVSNFICQALEGKDLTIYGDGSQTRSFCYVSDQVAGLMSLMASEYVHPVNIGNPKEFTIKQLAELVVAMINPSLKVIYQDLPADDPTQRRPDISIAKSELSWEPTIELEEGLKKTIAYFKSL